MQKRIVILTDSFPKLGKSITDVWAAIKSKAGVLNIVKTGFSGLWNVISAHPILAIATAIAILIPLLQKLGENLPTVENTGKRLEESSAEVQSLQSEIESLNGDLETTKKRIDELTNKNGTLSIVEKEELSRLKQTNAELARSIDLNKRRLAIAQSTNAKNFKENISALQDASIDEGWGYRYGDDVTAGTHDALGRGRNFLLDTSHLRQSAYFNYRIEDYKIYTEEIKKAEEAALKAYKQGDKDEGKEWDNKVSELKSKREKVEGALSGYTTDLESAYEKLGEYDYESLSASQKEAVDYVEDTINTYYLLINGRRDVFDVIYNQKRFAKGKEALEQLKETGDVTAESIANLYNNNKAVKAMINNMKKVGVINGEVEDSFGNIAEQIKGDEKEAKKTFTTIEGLLGDSSDNSFSSRIKTYRENIAKLGEALEKIRNGTFDNDSYHTLIEAFPKLAGESDNLDEAIVTLMDDMDSKITDDFNDQFGKLETQEDVDALKAYQKEVLNTRDTNQSFVEAFDSYFYKIKRLSDEYNSLTNGNVDYNKRPFVSPEKMKEAYPEFDGEIATTYSQNVEIGDGKNSYTIEITPILEDGTVLNQESLQDYIENLITDGGTDELLASDKYNLILNVQPGLYNEKYWDDYQNKIDKVKNEHWAAVEELRDSTGLTVEQIQDIYTNGIDAVNSKTTTFNSNLEETVSAFSTLKSVVDDYYENGYLTIDNLTSILSLSDKYINALTDESGAIDLSTESYKKLVAAEIEELKAQTLQESLDTVSNIKNKTEALAYLENSQKSAAESSLSLADAQWTEALATAKVRDIEEGTGDLYERTVNQAYKAYKTKIAMIESYADTAFTVGELQTATDDYETSLNNEKDALEDSKDALEDQKDALEDQKDALEDAKDALEDQKDALEDTKDGYEDAINSIKDLVDWVQDYIKQIKNDEIDALEKKKDAIDDLIEAQKDLLDAEKDEYEWNKTVKEKQNAVASDALAASIADLDDSAAGRKAQKEATDQLNSSREDLLDSLYDHAIEERKDALDELKDEQDAYYDEQIEAINNYLNDEVQLYKDACAMIDSDTGDLYDKLLTYCLSYTTTTEAEFTHMWNAAQAAMETYNTANLSTFDLLNSLQGEIYNIDSAIDELAQSISDYDTAIDNIQSSIDTLSDHIDTFQDKIDTVQDKIDDLGKSAKQTLSEISAAADDIRVTETDVKNAQDKRKKSSESSGSHNWSITWTDNSYAVRALGKQGTKVFSVKASSKEAAVKDLAKQIGAYYYPDYNINQIRQTHILSEVRKYVDPYASGTSSASGGLSLVGERGAELRVLNSGDGILKNEIVQGLSALGSNPAQFIAEASQKLMNNLFNTTSNLTSLPYIKSSQAISPSINIVVQGDATQSTIKALKAEAENIINKATRNVMKVAISHNRTI